MLYARLSHEMSGTPPAAICRHATGTLLQRENVPARVASVVNTFNYPFKDETLFFFCEGGGGVIVILGGFCLFTAQD